jgi:hypothetical protein
MSTKPFEFVPGMPPAAGFMIDNERDGRIKEKYQALVDAGLYEQSDMRSFQLGSAVTIVHFNDKTLYVMTYPILSATPAGYIKTCSCGTVMYKELERDIHEVDIDLEKILDAIALEVDSKEDLSLLDKPNTDFDGDPAVRNPHDNTPALHLNPQVDFHG